MNDSHCEMRDDLPMIYVSGGDVDEFKCVAGWLWLELTPTDGFAPLR